MQPMASVVMTRNDARPGPMYIAPDDADGACREILDLLISESETVSWTWDIAHGPMPIVAL